MSNDLVLACYNVSRTYQDGKLKVDVIQNLDLEVKPGESVSIVGASGSGKSTLLHIMGGLDTPSSGEVRWMTSFDTTAEQVDAFAAAIQAACQEAA